MNTSNTFLAQKNLVRSIDVQFFIGYYLPTLKTVNNSEYSKYYIHKMATGTDVYYNHDNLITYEHTAHQYYASQEFINLIHEPYYQTILSLDLVASKEYIDIALPAMLHHLHQFPIRHLNYDLISLLKTIRRLNLIDQYELITKYKNEFKRANICFKCGGKLTTETSSNQRFANLSCNWETVESDEEDLKEDMLLNICIDCGEFI